MGDLMLTCMGGQSRNRAVGVRLGKGEPITAILNDRKKVRLSVCSAACAGYVTDGLLYGFDCICICKPLGLHSWGPCCRFACKGAAPLSNANSCVTASHLPLSSPFGIFFTLHECSVIDDINDRHASPCSDKVQCWIPVCQHMPSHDVACLVYCIQWL